MSDSSGQRAVMSQLAHRRSLSIPGFRSARSNLGLPVPNSLSFRSNARLPADFGSPRLRNHTSGYESPSAATAFTGTFGPPTPRRGGRLTVVDDSATGRVDPAACMHEKNHPPRWVWPVES